MQTKGMTVLGNQYPGQLGPQQERRRSLDFKLLADRSGTESSDPEKSWQKYRCVSQIETKDEIPMGTDDVRPKMKHVQVWCKP